MTIGPYLRIAAVVGARRRDARIQPGGLARGQRAAGDEPDRARRAASCSTRAVAGRICARARGAAAAAARSRASASSSGCWSRVSWSWARARSTAARHRAAAAAAAHPRAGRASRPAAWMLWGADRLRPAAPPRLRPGLRAALAGRRGLRRRRRLQAKYHRLAALVLLGGAGVVTCVTFVWLSAPDLAVTQLLVEIVTTVLLLLGLRWLPKRLEEIAARLTLPRARCAAAATSSSPSPAASGMPAIAYAVMTRRSTARRRRLFPRARLRRGRRHQRRQRDPRRLPRLRHLGRDHRARHRRADRLRAAAAVPPGAGERRACPSSSASRTRFDDEREDREPGDTVRDYSWCPRSSCAGCSR